MFRNGDKTGWKLQDNRTVYNRMVSEVYGSQDDTDTAEIIQNCCGTSEEENAKERKPNRKQHM